MTMSGSKNRLYPPPSDLPSEEHPQPEWVAVHRDLRWPAVTLMLLWEEYCDATSDGFSYSWFCERYKERASRLKLSLRQVHVAGDKLFVDYSGHTMEDGIPRSDFARKNARSARIPAKSRGGIPAILSPDQAIRDFSRTTRLRAASRVAQ
jgi:transposase